MEDKIYSLVIAFLVSFFTTALVVRFSKNINILITDHLHIGPQTFHKNPTPRIGGLSIFLGFVFSSFYISMFSNFGSSVYILIVVSFLAFLSGFLEDITGKLHPKIRFFLITVAGVLTISLLDTYINRVDIPLIDYLLNVWIVSFIFTVFAIVGLTNAINIIDGFNGLASMVSVMILLSISYVAYINNDHFVMMFCLIFVAATIGFFIFNFPKGSIFMGDGGAYLTGFFISVMSIILVYRNPAVSPWFALMVNGYPVVETIFSMYRRIYIREISAFKPDGLHLHTLIYRIYVE